MFDEAKDEGWNASEADPVTIPCPGCGKEFEHNAWTLVNARQNPELVERLMEGTLFEFTCPHCGYTASLVQPCLYLDPTKRACVYLVADEDMARMADEMFQEYETDDGQGGLYGSTRRIVFDRHELRGKAVAISNDLDDRAIELVKTAASGSAKVEGYVPEGVDCIVNLAGIEDDNLVFHLDIGEDSLTSLIPIGGYELFANAIAQSSIRDEQPFIVDKDWANHATDVLVEEELMG